MVRSMMSFKSLTGPGATGAFKPAAERPRIVGGAGMLVVTTVCNGSVKCITGTESPKTKVELGISESSWQLLTLVDAESESIISL